MPTLTIDGREIEVDEGATLLDAARRLGLVIPTLCHRDGHPPLTSCMVCLVKARNPDRMLPACTARAEDGMVVESETVAVRDARRTALELLLGDHLGDCEAPCQAICPAGLAIPRMTRRLRDGAWDQAAAIVRTDLVLPATLGRICPAPCERGCRRGSKDAAVSIRALHRAAADRDAGVYVPPAEAESGRRVAVVGAGPAGLAAAYHLLMRGHGVMLIDAHEEAGGKLRTDIEEDLLPRDVLDAEIDVLAKLGAELRLGETVETLGDLRGEFDAVVVATGEGGPDFGLETTKSGLQVDRATGATSAEGIFAAGGAVRKSRMAVRSVGEGKRAAASVDQFLSGDAVEGPTSRLSVHIGQVSDEEMAVFMNEGANVPRVEPSGGEAAGLSPEEATREAGRCLHCDCRKAESCRLRDWGDACGAKPTRYKHDERRVFRQNVGGEIVYEPGKCIACGICIQIAEEARERLGLAFIGRGFDVRVGVPFGESIAEGLRETGGACVAACPTGALARIDQDE